jgi:hypothetical protein
LWTTYRESAASSGGVRPLGEDGSAEVRLRSGRGRVLSEVRGRMPRMTVTGRLELVALDANRAGAV